MIWIGWLLIVFGLLFLALSAMAALGEIRSKKSLETNEKFDPSIIRDVTEFIKTLGSQPKSLMYAVLGILFLVGGALMVKNPDLAFLKQAPADTKPAAPASAPAAPAPAPVKP